jgi:3-phosphoinositide dependent protein kinase-1
MLGDRESFSAYGQADSKETFVGTPLYVAPEMLSDCISVPASDLWSLGVMIYKMHTGQFPFESPV